MSTLQGAALTQRLSELSDDQELPRECRLWICVVFLERQRRPTWTNEDELASRLVHVADEVLRGTAPASDVETLANACMARAIQDALSIEDRENIGRQ